MDNFPTIHFLRRVTLQQLNLLDCSQIRFSSGISYLELPQVFVINLTHCKRI